MISGTVFSVLSLALLYGVMSAKIFDSAPPIEMPTTPLLSAFEKTYLASASEVATSDYDFYSGEATKTVLIRNVGFGVFGAQKVAVGFDIQGEEVGKGKVQFRIDNVNGQIISDFSMGKNGSSWHKATASAPVIPVKGYHDLYVSYSSEIKGNASWFQFEVSGPNPEDYYIITSVHNGQSIKTEPSIPEVFVKPYTYGLGQMLRFTKTVYNSYVISTRGSDLNFDLRNAELFSEKVPIYIYPNKPNSQQSQEWYIDPAGGGSVKIMSRVNGRCVTLHTNGYLIQFPCLNAPTQRWYFIPVCKY